MDISVVIPTFNRKHLLRRVLDALASQADVGSITYEVLVCDDGSTDGTADLCREVAANYPVSLRYIEGQHSGGPSLSRNAGAVHARGHVLVYVDDDAVPASDLLACHAEFHRARPEPQAAAVGRLVIPDEDRANPMVIFSDFPYHQMEGGGQLGYLFFWTGNFSIKRDFMRAYGGFRPEPRLYPIEDMDCGYRLCQNGMDLRYLPEATCMHYPTVNPARIGDRGRRTGTAQFNLFLVTKDPAMLRRFGVLTPEIGWAAFAELAIKRVIFRAVDQPVTHAILRTLGATNGQRSRWSDLYYYMTFRRHMIAGYEQARREHARSTARDLAPVPRLMNVGGEL